MNCRKWDFQSRVALNALFAFNKLHAISRARLASLGRQGQQMTGVGHDTVRLQLHLPATQ